MERNTLLLFNNVASDILALNICPGALVYDDRKGHHFKNLAADILTERAFGDLGGENASFI